MIRVVRRVNEPLEKTMRRFFKRCEKENLNKEMRKIEYYEPPSVVRRREVVKRKKLLSKLKHGTD